MTMHEVVVTRFVIMADFILIYHVNFALSFALSYSFRNLTIISSSSRSFIAAEDQNWFNFFFSFSFYTGNAQIPQENSNL